MRCNSIYKTYRIDENEDLIKALRVFSMLNTGKTQLVLKNLKTKVVKSKTMIEGKKVKKDGKKDEDSFGSDEDD